MPAKLSLNSFLQGDGASFGPPAVDGEEQAA